MNRRWKAVKSEFWNRAVKSGVDIIKDCAQENRAPNIQNIVASAIEVARGLWVSIEEDEPETSEDELSNNRDREPRYVQSLPHEYGCKKKKNLPDRPPPLARKDRQRDTRPTNPLAV